jgi:phosphoglycerate dehydrogenase-like enzyme
VAIAQREHCTDPAFIIEGSQTMKINIFISSPLEVENVDRIRSVDPDRIEVVFEPDLLPPVRYIADHRGAPFTRSPQQQQRWQAALATAEVLWDLPQTAADLATAKRLKWIQTTSTGVGPSVKALGLQTSDILVTTARGVHAGPLAEFVFMALLAHFRGLRNLDAEQQAHRWIRTCGTEIAGKTITLLGAGDLARGVAKVARALDMRVTAIARHPQKERSTSHLFDAIYGVDDLHHALSQADAVVVTVPHTAETDKMIDDAAFRAMRPGVALINIGRGQVLDETALVKHLQSGHIGFAGLDVATVEPLPPDSPLWDMPNVLISPHSASTVTTENAKITDIFMHNLHCYLDGRTGDMRNVFDKVLLY